MNRRLVLARLGSGLAMLAWPAALAPAWTIAVASLGAIAMVAAAAGGRSPAAVGHGPPSGRWPALAGRGPARGRLAALAGRAPAAVSVAVGAAVVICAFSHAGTLALAAEGMLILACVLAANVSSEGLVLRAAVGVAATILVATALAVHPHASAWLTAIGLIAIVAAFILAVPMKQR